MTPAQRIAELEAEVERLRELLGVTVRDSGLQRLVRLKFPPRLARLAIALFQRGERPTPYYLYEEICPPQDHAAERDILTLMKVDTCNLRKKLGRDAITTLWGQGVVLSPSGRVRVAALLGVPP